MSILLLAPPETRHGTRLLPALRDIALPAEDFRPFDTVEELFAALRRADRERDLLVLAPADRNTLTELVVGADLVARVRTVVMLPDDAAATVAAGHRLRPRYVTYASAPLEDLVAVVTRMSGRRTEGDGPPARPSGSTRVGGADL